MSSKRHPRLPGTVALAGLRVTPEGILSAAAELARADLVACSSRILLRHDRIVRQVTRGEVGSFDPEDARKVKRVRRALTRLQKRVRDMISVVVAGRERLEMGFQRARASGLQSYWDKSDRSTYYDFGKLRMTFIEKEHSHLQIPVRVSIRVEGGSARIDGSAHDLFVLKLQGVLDSELAYRLRACPNCRTVFLRNRRQEYCTADCRDRTYYQKWKNTPNARAARAREYAKHGWKVGARKHRRI